MRHHFADAAVQRRKRGLSLRARVGAVATGHRRVGHDAEQARVHAAHGQAAQAGARQIEQRARELRHVRSVCARGSGGGVGSMRARGVTRVG